ncbi:MAG: CaiB/BaiF CoA-transferase family protein, partial [Afipia sp.]|nr:CaiB/BaiF CoA-transferase family protein [Afipia sp.]
MAMAQKCDVIVHNFRPGAMAKFGLGYDAVRARNPRIVYCEFTAYGQKGPMSHVGANDLALQAHSGLISLTGEADRPPVRVGTAAIDLHGSLAIVSAVLAALFQRERTGDGQQVETSLLQSSAHLLNYFYTEYWMEGTVRKPMGTANHLSVPNQVFPTSDGGVVIIAPTNEMWQRMVKALESSELERPEFATTVSRLHNRDLLVATLSAVTQRMPVAEVVRRLSAVKVNVAKVNSVGEAADHAQLAAIDGFVEFDVGGRQVKAVATPFKMSGSECVVDRPPPRLDIDSQTILREFGFDDAGIAALKAQGAFGKPS